jgi:hypothetical protein
MTRAEYAELGYELPECECEIVGLSDGLWTVALSAKPGLGDVFIFKASEMPTREDVLHRLLCVEAKEATRFLRDFVADWPNQSYAGRQAAIREWKRLRRQRVRLKRLFLEHCP